MNCVRNFISELDAKCIVMLNGGGTPAGGPVYQFGYDLGRAGHLASAVGDVYAMHHRLTWFLIGAAVASVFWIAVLRGIGNEWLNILLQAS